VVAEREASREVLQMVAVKVKLARAMAVLKRYVKAVLRLWRAEEFVQFSQKAAVPLMAARPPLLEAARPTRVWGPAQVRTLALMRAPSLMQAWAWKRMAKEMTAEMVTAARVTSERTAAGRMVTDGVEERAESV
jgi:hypothetical protein